MTPTYEAFSKLKEIGASVIDHGDPDVQWGAEFILSAELQGYSENEVVLADYYHEQITEKVDDEGHIHNAFGIDEKVHAILKPLGLHAEWIDAGTIGIYA